MVKRKRPIMKKPVVVLLTQVFVLFFLVANAQSHYPGQHVGKFVVQDKLAPAVYSFDLQDVRLLDSRFKQNMEREETWLLSVDVNRLLHSFRTNAGVPSGLEGGNSKGN